MTKFSIDSGAGTPCHFFPAAVHTAAQPSHELAASRPFDDFDVNAGGTLNLLEAETQPFD
jgi:nucleoside-diphosphate-sugar epimerase